MANVWAIKNGDWSDTTVWNTGALPTSADDVYANNFNVNVNQNITVNSLRNTANTGLTAGGTFTFNTGGVTANINDNLYNGAVNFIVITASAGNIIINAPSSIIQQAAINNSIFINYTGNCDFSIFATKLIGANVNASIGFIRKTSLGNLTINANLQANENQAAYGMIYLNSNSNTIINGDLIAGTYGANNSCVVIGVMGNLTVNGNLIGSNLTQSSGAINWNSTGNLNIVGNIGGGLSKSLTVLKGNVNVTGIITGSNTIGLPSVDIQGTATFNHIGTAQASVYASAIQCNTPTTSTVTCTGPFLKNGYIVAIASQTLRINFGSNSYFQFKKSNGEDIDYVSTVEGYNYPTPADVRYGVEYKSGLAIGTCHVPTPDNVRKNIPVDNTVGTSDNVNAEDILEAIQNSPLPIAERLRNVATVESTGAQLEAYQ